MGDKILTIFKYGKEEGQNKTFDAGLQLEVSV